MHTARQIYIERSRKTHSQYYWPGNWPYYGNIGELEAIKLGTDLIVWNIRNARNLFVYSDLQRGMGGLSIQPNF